MINAIRNTDENYKINVTEYEINQAITNLRLLHRNDDGFITLASKNAKKWKQFHYKQDELINNIEQAIGIEANIYVSPNSFFRPMRKIENIRKLNGLYIDVDFYNINLYKECSYEYMMNLINNDYFESGLLPQPTFTIFTGKGLAYYWVIEPCHVNVLPLWNVVQRHFLETLSSVGADSKSIDSARVMRLAGSTHIEANNKVKLYVNDEYLIYRLADIQKDYLPDLTPGKESIADRIHKKKHKTSNGKNKSKKNKSKVIGLYNQLKLHYTRLMDLVKLQEMRNGYCRNENGELIETGQREEMCFLYRYWCSCYCNDYDLALENTLEFNQGFKVPLSEKEVTKVTKSAVKAYEEWLKDEKEKDVNKRGKQVGTRIYKHKGYNYKNETLIKLLNITYDEMKELDTIISKDLKKERKNTKERAKRRNDDGLTPKQQERKEFLHEVEKLMESGYKQIEIAEKLNKNKSTISRAIKEIKEKNRN